MLLFKDWINKDRSNRSYSLRMIVSEMKILSKINDKEINSLIDYVEKNYTFFNTLINIPDEKKRKKIIRDCVLDFESNVSRKTKSMAEQLIKNSKVKYKFDYLKLIKNKCKDLISSEVKYQVHSELTNREIYRQFEKEVKIISGEHRFDIINKREEKCKELFGCSHIYKAYRFSKLNLDVKDLFGSEQTLELANAVQLKIRENILSNAKKRERMRNKKEYIKTYDEILLDTDENLILLFENSLWSELTITRNDNAMMMFKRNREYLKLYELLFNKLTEVEKEPTSTHEDKFEYVISLERAKKEALKV